MPTFDSQEASNDPIKMLIVGPSGTGKSGSLVSLALAGYKLRILDYDNGLDPLFQYLKGKKVDVQYEKCLDKFTVLGGKPSPAGVPMALAKGLGCLDLWPTDKSKPTSWGKDTVLVLDSLTFFGHAALRRVCYDNKRVGPPWIGDWGDAMGIVENTLAMLYSDAIQCNVIVTSHIVSLGGDEKTGAGAVDYPSALGSKLPPKVGRYFNTMLQTANSGIGATTKKVIRTVPEGSLGVKCPVLNLPKTLSVETGLADFFKAFYSTTKTA